MEERTFISVAMLAVADDRTGQNTYKSHRATVTRGLMCGICLVVGDDRAAERCRDVLSKLQHRGQQGAKIYASDNGGIKKFGGSGLVMEELAPANLKAMDGSWAVGQNRYTTSGPDTAENVQPFNATTPHGHMVFAHNGQFGTERDIEQRKDDVVGDGIPLARGSDSELFLASFIQSDADSIGERLRDAFRANAGSGAIVGVIDDDTAFAGRRVGNRPLFMGRTDRGGYVFASEDYMFDLFSIEDAEPVPAGTVYLVQDGDLQAIDIWEEDRGRRFCLFELFYFSHPLTSFRGTNISDIRRGFGRQLAREHPVDADIVASVPDSGNHAAVGYARESGIPLDHCIIRNHYTGRTFIGGKQSERREKSVVKYDVDPATVEGRHVAVIDDSLVRSTTARTIIRKLREAGVNEISFLLASPPIRYPNYYGIDMKTRDELAAAGSTPEDIREMLDISYLGYLSLDGAYEVIEDVTGQTVADADFCDAVFTGDYWDVTLPDSVQDAGANVVTDAGGTEATP